MSVHLPSLGGATEWLGSEPVAPAELRGHVVLVNFWTLTCINWLRQEPYVRAWSQAYRDDGLVVIGVHTPEFSFEHEVDLVRRATAERTIDYPVVVDNDYAIWSAFANHYWPALYFVDADGIIRDQHFGEGRYEYCERVIQRLLGVERDRVSVEGTGVEAAADWDNLRTRGDVSGARARRALQPVGAGRPVDDRAAKPSCSTRRAGHQPSASTRATRTSCCRPEGGTPIPFRVLLDGEAPGLSRGVHVDEDGNGMLRDGGMYQLVRQHEAVRARTLEITFLDRIQGYQRIPVALQRQPQLAGPSPAERLVNALGTIEEQLARAGRRLAADDLHALATQQRYLELKYKDGHGKDGG